MVDNTVIYIPIDGNDTSPEPYRGYVNPGFPLIKDDFLVSNGASFGGLVKRELLSHRVASVSHVYGICYLVYVLENTDDE